MKTVAKETKYALRDAFSRKCVVVPLGEKKIHFFDGYWIADPCSLASMLFLGAPKTLLFSGWTRDRLIRRLLIGPDLG